MIGQKNLLAKIDLYNVDTFPRSVLLLGERGSGKHTLVNYIRDNIIKFEAIDITENISDEYIDQIYRTPTPYIYVINLTLLTEKQQNIILKFIEEPLNNAFIILLAENKNFVLNTVINRCITFEMEAYSRDELASFLTVETDKELILNVLRTPGKILSTNISRMQELFNLCDKIITKMNIANYANTLTIANKINFKDNFDRFDIDIFFDTLCFSLYNKFLSTSDVNILKIYELTRDQRKLMRDTRINKELFFEHFLTKLWKFSRGEI